MWLGQSQLGTYLDFWLQCTDADGVKSMPDYVPWLKVWIGSDLVQTLEMPVIDKVSQVGLFCEHLFLGNQFSLGQGTAEMHYRVGGKFGIETRTFEIIAGGHTDGQTLGMYWYPKPDVEYVVFQSESGKITKGKGARVT